MSEYEREKEENIARNKLLLADLGLDKPFFEPKETRQAPTKKRKAPADKEPSDRSSPAKVSRVVSEGESSELRRSQRNVGKSIDYKGPLKRPDLPPVRSSIDDHRGPFGREFGKRTQNPCVAFVLIEYHLMLLLGRDSGTYPGLLWEHGGNLGNKNYFETSITKTDDSCIERVAA